VHFDVVHWEVEGMYIKTVVTLIGAALGLASASFWGAAAVKHVTRDQEIARREREAEKKGEKPNYGGMSVNGVDPFATIALQSRLNAIGAAFGAAAVIVQTIASFLPEA
jgi:hypothetical protein